MKPLNADSFANFMFANTQLSKYQIKDFKLRITYMFLLFFTKLFLYLLYKLYLKADAKEDFEILLEKAFLKKLEGDGNLTEEELLEIAKLLSPFWSKELRDMLVDTAKEAFFTYQLKREFINQCEDLKFFLDLLKT